MPEIKPDKFVQCVACGTFNHENRVTCRTCGKPLYGTKECEACRVEIPIGAKFCGNCGNRQGCPEQ